MDNNRWFWKKIKRADGKYVWYAFTICQKCGHEFQSNNAARAKYCKNCKMKVVREQTRARVQRHRANTTK